MAVSQIRDARRRRAKRAWVSLLFVAKGNRSIMCRVRCIAQRIITREKRGREKVKIGRNFIRRLLCVIKNKKCLGRLFFVDKKKDV